MAAPFIVVNEYWCKRIIQIMTTGDRERFQTPELVVAETGAYVPEQQAYLNLIRTAEVLRMGVADLFASRGLSGKQYNVLRALRRGGPRGLTASQIGEQMTEPRADTTRLIDRMVRDGLVRRVNDEEDRRVVRSFLTDAGMALLVALDEPLLAAHREQFSSLTPDELRTLISLLERARRDDRK